MHSCPYTFSRHFSVLRLKRLLVKPTSCLSSDSHERDAAEKCCHTPWCGGCLDEVPAVLHLFCNCLTSSQAVSSAALVCGVVHSAWSQVCVCQVCSENQAVRASGPLWFPYPIALPVVLSLTGMQVKGLSCPGTEKGFSAAFAGREMVFLLIQKKDLFFEGLVAVWVVE